MPDDALEHGPRRLKIGFCKVGGRGRAGLAGFGLCHVRSRHLLSRAPRPGRFDFLAEDGNVGVADTQDL